MRFYVYELIDPRTGLVFYVGKGCRDRIDQHEVEARKGRQSRKCAQIRDIEASGFTVGKRRTAHFTCEQAAYDAEAELITFYGLANLTNVIPGGFGKATGHTLYDDRLVVRGYAQILNRTRGKPFKFLVLGIQVNLKPFLDGIDASIAKIVARRGLEWVNNIAGRYSVEFEALAHG